MQSGDSSVVGAYRAASAAQLLQLCAKLLSTSCYTSGVVSDGTHSSPVGFHNAVSIKYSSL